MTFSIIVPTYNSQSYIHQTVSSILNQIPNDYTFEILLIDDCSTDNTFEILQALKNSYPTILQLFKTLQNSGPGISRNIGLDHAKGDWILFLDSDDLLASDALLLLSKLIRLHPQESTDLIVFNWKYNLSSTSQIHNKGGRTDFESLSKTKFKLLQDYVSLKMDGSVIYTLIKKDLIDTHSLRFSSGYHEDVDFLFNIYNYTKKITLLQEPIYIKNNRIDSIINSMSEKHLEGFFRAYQSMFLVTKKMDFFQNLIDSFYLGLIGIIATRLRIIYTMNVDKQLSDTLYLSLYNHYQNFLKMACEIKPVNITTKYGIITDTFIKILQTFSTQSEQSLSHLIDDFMKNTIQKSWSCTDLHHSLFLAPNEIRTCCKRFFFDGSIKGDVSLLRTTDYKYSNFSIANIFDEKKALYLRINKGEAQECLGCPFLEFKEWGPIEESTINYLSLEYHSICNMKCTYCSETYYGGKSPDYDVAKIISEGKNRSLFSDSIQIVWGGGEPTLDKSFDTFLNLFAEKPFTSKQRIITNSTIYSPLLHQLINDDKASIVTSIDAGTAKVFNAIRHNKNFLDIFKNLQKYASSVPQNVTIKYILLNENSSLEELSTFIEQINSFNLTRCNFQISCNFKDETVSLDLSIAAIILYGLLQQVGVSLIFFDDLLRMRLKDIYILHQHEIELALEKINMSNIVEKSSLYSDIVIWGAGMQTKYLLENTLFFLNPKIAFIADNTPSKIGTTFLGYTVVDPKELLHTDHSILISAVQNTPKILEQYQKLGLDDKRLIKGLIL